MNGIVLEAEMHHRLVQKAGPRREAGKAAVMTGEETGPTIQPIFRAEISKDPAELDRLARQASGPDRDGIRMSVAENLHTGAATLAQLSEDRYSGTRWAVARNPNTDPLTLDHLTRDLDSGVMDCAEDMTFRRCLEGPDRVAGRWKPLAARMCRDARLTAEGEKTGRPTQAQFDAGQRLAERRYDRRRQHYALTTPSRALIDQFLLGGNPTLRWMAARNQHTTFSQLASLERDGRRQIALEAFKQLNAIRLAAAAHRKGLPSDQREYLAAPGWRRAELEAASPHLVEQIVGVSIEEDIRSHRLSLDRTVGRKRKPQFVKAL